ncbi:phospholipase D family protein [Gracilibacillus marinus]|uniref:phospholipase D n=1 Tax=Gracilibacillus marinus TaxID=630535 RepID=A0ABV8VYM0_9BACI
MKNKWYVKKRYAFILFLVIYLCVIVYHQVKPLPEGVSVKGEKHAIDEKDVEFLVDLTYTKNEEEHYEHEIFEQVYQVIGDAEKFLIIDMFMINDSSSTDRDYPKLSAKLKEKITLQKEKFPDLKVVVITDPINTTYYSHEAKYIDSLEQIGVEVVYTDLDRLRDPNPLYSGVWRMFFQWFGQGGNGFLPNPFGEPSPDVTIRSYLKTLNVKANHRKVIITEKEGLVLSANAHDASGFHSNIGWKVKGEILKDMLASEKAVVQFSGGNVNAFPIEEEINTYIEDTSTSSTDVTVQLLTEQKIEDAVVEAIQQAEQGDTIWVAMFYIADRSIIDAIEEATERKVHVKLILDPNENAFGQQKIGVPNIPMADELLEDGNNHLEVKWYNVNKEQFHTKLLYVNYGETSKMIGGSANYTSRNLNDYNLETNIAVEAKNDTEIVADVDTYFHRLWENEDAVFTLPYEEKESLPILKRIGYTIQKLTMFTTY